MASGGLISDPVSASANRCHLPSAAYDDLAVGYLDPERRDTDEEAFRLRSVTVQLTVLLYIFVTHL